MEFKKKSLRIAAIIIVCSLIYACNDNKHAKISSIDSADSMPINISYQLPDDLRVNATQEELAIFAWKEFFALNWKSSFNTDLMRTTPDTTWNLDSLNGDPFLTVWETYIHRTELRPANGIRTRNLDSLLPHYTFIDNNSINYTLLPKTINNYWNILDEDNEIGSSYLFNLNANDSTQVLYSAKTNLEEYNYIKNNFKTDTALYAATSKGKKSFKNLSKAQMCESADSTICLPCAGVGSFKEGAIEIKLAFRKLDLTKDSVNRFITKQVVVFKDSIIKGVSTLYAHEETFGLIGMHIIRKTKNYPAFILTSFEQIDVRNDNMQTIGIDKDSVLVNNIKYNNVDPHRLNPVIERVIPETIQRVNKRVEETIKKQNSTSKWQYYQLIGVQATPIDYKDRTSDNNYFMANYVIESDLLLTNFHGSFNAPFDESLQNVVFDKQSYNMGGCQGCHGQAQKGGTDFSFLLDSGAGKPVNLPDPYQTYQEALDTANPLSGKSHQLTTYLKTLNY